jgi:hypothetical protein
MRSRRVSRLAVVVLSLTWLVPVVWGQELDYEREPIAYLTAPVNDPIARLDTRISEGEASLAYDRAQGYLPSVLEALGVSPTSQVLVFSKTSFQHTRIAPQTPRALYFGDDVYIGWVRGGDYLEISAVDPRQGAVFYLLDQQRTARPRFERQTHTCLSCHSSGKTQGVPGHLVRSVFPDRSGQPVYNAGSFLTDHSSPLAERWGGWYVTGTHGDQTHMGNALVLDRDHPEQLDIAAGGNITDLNPRFNTRPYLTPHSDLVALMVLEHQTQGHNRITAANYHARLARYYDEGINKALGRPLDYLSPTSARRIERAAEELADYLLFVGEAPLTEAVSGTSGFAERFAALGPRDAQGRSLRDFDLRTRLFRHPVSYLIHTEAFHALPAAIKNRVYDRLARVLTGRDDDPKYAHLDPDTRRATLEVLRGTLPDFSSEACVVP